MNRLKKIAFGQRTAHAVGAFEYAVLFDQTGVKATQNNGFRKLVKTCGTAVSHGNGIMAQALKNTKFSGLYDGVKGQKIAIFFQDRDSANLLYSIRRKFKEFQTHSGMFCGERMTADLVSLLSKSKTNEHMYLKLMRVLTAPVRQLIKGCEKLIEKKQDGTKTNAEEVLNMLSELSLETIAGIACTILEKAG